MFIATFIKVYYTIIIIYGRFQQTSASIYYNRYNYYYNL